MTSSADSLDLISALLTNLRNARATFGEASPQYASVKATVDEHIAALNLGAAAGAQAQAPAQATNLDSPASAEAAAPSPPKPSGPEAPGLTQSQADLATPRQQPQMFNLAFRPRPGA